MWRRLLATSRSFFAVHQGRGGSGNTATKPYFEGSFIALPLEPPAVGKAEGVKQTSRQVAPALEVSGLECSSIKDPSVNHRGNQRFIKACLE